MNDYKNLSLLSLILGNNRSLIEDFINKEDINFDNFSKFLRLNRIDGFVYFYLIQNNLSDIFPTQIVEEYKYHYDYQIQKNTALVQHCSELQELLTKHGFDLIFLKGPFFTMQYYGDIGQREIADVDILIKNDNSCIKVDQILKSNEYQLRSISLFGWYISTLFTHHYEYSKDNMKLDMHWVLQNHYSFKINYDKIWNCRQTFFLNQQPYNILSDEYELVFRILSIFMDIQLGTIRIKSLIDLHMILNKVDNQFDWNKFFESRKEEGLFRISVNVINILMLLLDCRSSFMKLNNYIDNQQNLIIYRSFKQVLSLFESQRFAIRNKMWAFKAYNCPGFMSYLWWIISLPVKLLVYKEATKKSARNLFKR